MIDIENKIVDAIQEAFTAAGIQVTVSSTFVSSPAEFPWVYVREMSNITYQGSLDTSLREHHATVTYRIEVYSNLADGAKSQAKQLREIADLAMQDMRFTRTSSSFVPNYDRSITRLISDYRAVVQEGVTDDGVTTHQMYRG